MPKGFVFGSSTPRELSHQKVAEKCRVLDAIAAADSHHDVRPFIRNIHSGRSGSVPRNPSKGLVFGSSTPREWSHLGRLPAEYRLYNSKPPPKNRSQTIASLRNAHNSSSVSLGTHRQQPATSRESRPRNPKINLPPVPSTSRTHRSTKNEDDDDAASEPDIKMDRNGIKELQKKSPIRKPNRTENPKKPTNVSEFPSSDCFKEMPLKTMNHSITHEPEPLYEQQEALVDNVNKQVTATYHPNEEVFSVPVVRKPETDFSALTDDLQISAPVQIDVAENVQRAQSPK